MVLRKSWITLPEKDSAWRGFAPGQKWTCQVATNSSLVQWLAHLYERDKRPELLSRLEAEVGRRTTVLPSNKAEILLHKTIRYDGVAGAAGLIFLQQGHRLGPTAKWIQHKHSFRERLR
jgi:hypothetical protein